MQIKMSLLFPTAIQLITDRGPGYGPGKERKNSGFSVFSYRKQ